MKDPTMFVGWGLVIMLVLIVLSVLPLVIQRWMELGGVC